MELQDIDAFSRVLIHTIGFLIKMKSLLLKRLLVSISDVIIICIYE